MTTTDKVAENPLHISWHDSAWIPVLNRGNVLKYFSERSNSFYDSTCNNEIIKMQGLSLEHLANMTGVEYALLHAQEPILYIIRKQQRHSPTHVTSIADYYIIAGVVYQAPDVKSVVNSRMTSTLHHIETAFSEAISYSRYHPSKGYWWQFTEDKAEEKRNVSKKRKKKKEDPGSIFQCRRVDQLLADLSMKFPHKYYQVRPGEKPVALQQNAAARSEQNPERVNQDSASGGALLPAGAAPGPANAAASANTRTLQSPVSHAGMSAVQARVKTEPNDGMKQPIEKRAKFV